jgi:hypothetical protein
MAASSNLNRLYGNGGQRVIAVKAASTIYAGTAVGLDGSGAARALVAGDVFAGWNRYAGTVDNSAGALAAKYITVDTFVPEVELAVTGVTGEEQIGIPVYATADNTFTIAVGARGASTCIGRVVGYVSSGVAKVEVGTIHDVEENYKHATAASVTTAGNATYTAAQLLCGLLKRDPAGSARSDVTPTAALIIAALRPNARRVGYSFEFLLQNIADNSEVITVTAGSDVTLDSAGVWNNLDHHLAKRIRVEVTAATTVTMYDLGLTGATGH